MVTHVRGSRLLDVWALGSLFHWLEYERLYRAHVAGDRVPLTLESWFWYATRRKKRGF
jgi:hypothetical protein